MKKLLLPLLFLPLVLSAAPAYKSFWLTEAVSGKTIGPIVNKPGNQFSLHDASWIVMQSGKNEINFSHAQTLQLEGPYDFVEQRLIDLGDKAYVITKIEPFRGNDPSRNEARLSQAIRAPAQRGRHAWSKDLPERWVLAPIPSTNPAAHRAPAPAWSLQQVLWQPSLSLFWEPMYDIAYDFSLDSHTGKEADIESSRMGIQGKWNGVLLEFGIFSESEGSGTLVQNGALLSDLAIGNGDGYFVSAGYLYEFEIDSDWSASIGMQASYSMRNYEISASLASTVAPDSSASGTPSSGAVDSDSPSDSLLSAPPPGWTGDERMMARGAEADASTAAGYQFYRHHSDFDWTEYNVTGIVGIQRSEWYWGVGAAVLLDFLSESDMDASIPYLNSSYKLGADRSQPLSLRLSGWYSPMDHLSLEGAVTFGSEQSIRLGISCFF